MTFLRHTIRLQTTKAVEVVDITSQVRDFTKSSGLRDGLIVVASRHTTLGVAINERCEKLQADMVDFLVRLVPPDGEYRHNLVAGDGRPNAHSHLLSLMVPSQVTLVLHRQNLMVRTVPHLQLSRERDVVEDGELDLGSWQSIFAIELDGPRKSREIALTAMGQ